MEHCSMIHQNLKTYKNDKIINYYKETGNYLNLYMIYEIF